MKQPALTSSELILNDDGSIYHLNLKPADIAETIITVGDPDRVEAVSKHFDALEVEVQKREFKTHTGTYKGKRITVISTGIGTDNIDIVLNELDALANIDFKTRRVKKDLTKLTIIRIGTSGAIQPTIPIDSFLVTETAIGFDNLLHFYGNISFTDSAFSEAFVQHTNWNAHKSTPYVVSADTELLKLFSSETDFLKGCTATNVGFYGPQGRVLRLQTEDNMLNDKLTSFQFQKKKITNLEMETSGIYGMATLLGHRAISLNAILANRCDQTFSKQPQKTVDLLIQKTLSILVA
ncbi:nucleoside phosphorylase [Cochleicola gelatinilyticus]|uniref:Uridine phosphorylase n=1 Tax=Cochleicola gelatinilyticus TaxID=1763537 RepID=A0A167GW59_9FLAO|nr:nucleoside phosphorylase [Cochleicola gelatinilyticus]OAB77964.1 phosphorylase [Cochleicola gelatinilyticus]